MNGISFLLKLIPHVLRKRRASQYLLNLAKYHVDFKEFFYHDAPRHYEDVEVANLYFHGQLPVREIAKTTSRSIGEVYRLIRKYGEPNRQRQDQGNVYHLADSGLSVRAISDFTGYTTRHIRNLLKK